MINTPGLFVSFDVFPIMKTYCCVHHSSRPSFFTFSQSRSWLKTIHRPL